MDKTFKADVKYDGGWLGYEVAHKEGVHTFTNREDTSEKIHFVVAGDYVVKSDDDDLPLYANSSERVKADGEKIINGEVNL